MCEALVHDQRHNLIVFRSVLTCQGNQRQISTDGDPSRNDALLGAFVRMSNTERADEKTANRRQQERRSMERMPSDASRELSSFKIAPLSARAAAAQFDLAAMLQMPPEPPRERALVAAANSEP